MSQPNSQHQKSLDGQAACEMKRLNDELGDVIRAAQSHAYSLGVAVHADAQNLLETIQANTDNAALSDADFRQFVRNSLANRQAG